MAVVVQPYVCQRRDNHLYFMNITDVSAPCYALAHSRASILDRSNFRSRVSYWPWSNVAIGWQRRASFRKDLSGDRYVAPKSHHVLSVDLTFKYKLPLLTNSGLNTWIKGRNIKVTSIINSATNGVCIVISHSHSFFAHTYHLLRGNCFRRSCKLSSSEADSDW